MDQPNCTIPKCPEPAVKLDWCQMHYMRWYRHGDPLALMRPSATGGIYRIAGPEGRVYIGSSDNLKRRWKAHKARLRRGDHHNYLLQADWTSAGEASFTFAVLEEIANPDDLIEAEQRHLDAAAEDGFVYNICSDVKIPFRGLIHTPEARLKMSVAIRAAMTPENLAGKRRRVQGSLNPGSKLDEAMVLEICRRLTSGAHPAEVAAEMAVSESAVYQIRRGQIWGHVVTAEMVEAMKAVRQNPWANGTRAVTDDMRTRFAAVGRSNKGRKPSAERSDQISRQSRGEGNPKAKLTDDDVREIRRRAAAGERNKDLATEFGIHPNSVSKIKTGETWQHIT